MLLPNVKEYFARYKPDILILGDCNGIQIYTTYFVEKHSII